MKKSICTGLVTLVTAILTACGGGGENTNDDSSSGANPASYWTLDSHQYINGGHSVVSTNVASDIPVTTAVVSTATLSGGDSANGAYSGSALTFVFKGTPAPGVYTVVPDRNSFIAADVSTAPILVEVITGIATNTGSSQYTAASGRVQITRDTSGNYHFSSVAAMPATKTADVLGGVASAPSTMTLTIVDAY